MSRSVLGVDDLPLSYRDYLRVYVPILQRAAEMMRDPSSRREAFRLMQNQTAALTLLSTVSLDLEVGAPAYALTRELQEEFGDAELPTHLTPEDLALPAPVVWVALPGSQVHLYGGEGTGWLRVHGAYLIDTQFLRDKRGLRLGKPAEGEDVESIPGVCVILWACPSSLTRDPADDAFFVAPFRAAEFSDMESAFLSRVGTSGGDVNPWTNVRLIDTLDPTGKERQWAAALTGVRQVISMLLHLNMRQRWVTEYRVDAAAQRAELLRSAEKVSEKKRRKREQRAEKMSEYTYIVLDAPPKPPAARERSGIASGAVGQRAGTWRRHHFRRVWYGSRTDPETGERRKGERYEWIPIPRVWVSGIGEEKRARTRVVTRRGRG